MYFEFDKFNINMSNLYYTLLIQVSNSKYILFECILALYRTLLIFTRLFDWIEINACVTKRGT
jgi:hypothetical protein